MSDDQTKKVLLNVEINNSDAIKKLAETKTRIAELRAEQKALDTSTDSGRQKFEILGQQIKALNTDSLTYQKTIQNEVKAQNELDVDMTPWKRTYQQKAIKLPYKI